MTLYPFARCGNKRIKKKFKRNRKMKILQLMFLLSMNYILHLNTCLLNAGVEKGEPHYRVYV